VVWCGLDIFLLLPLFLFWYREEPLKRRRRRRRWNLSEGRKGGLPKGGGVGGGGGGVRRFPGLPLSQTVWYRVVPSLRRGGPKLDLI
jgi:hypothetical protein